MGLQHMGALAKGMWEGAFNVGGNVDIRTPDNDKAADAAVSNKAHVAHQSNKSASSTLADANETDTVSLKECLRWFTRVEKLGAKAYK